MSNLLVISGLKRSGKDTVANIVRKELGYDKTVSYALAKPIKYALFYGFNDVRIRKPNTREPFTIADFNGDGFDRESDLNLTHHQVYSILMKSWQYIESEMPDLEKYRQDVISLIEGINADNEFGINMDKPWTIRRLMQVFGTDICVTANEFIWMKFMMNEFLDVISDNKLLIVTDCRQEHEMKLLRRLGGKFWFIKRDMCENKDTHITEKGLQYNSDDVIIQNNETLFELESKVKSLLVK